jgi:pSer/pThr/pTyr-binding forkhead associated (FHA) protein
MPNDVTTQVIDTEPKVYLVDSHGTAIKIVGEMTVGRSDDSDFVITDPKASRKHAKITVDGEGLLVDDLGSTNGSVHEGARKQNFRAVNGDVLSFPNDAYTLRVEAPFMTPEIDPDKTMPMDVSEINALAAQVSPSESTNDVDVKESALDSNVENQNSAWWESSEKKSDGTAVFNVNDIGSNKVNVAALVKLGPAIAPRLVVKSGAEAGTEFKLSIGSFVIGKDTSCEIRLKEETVSDQHAKLIHDGHTWQLVNLLALNHTLVNDEKIQSIYLNSGDQIRMGGALLVFQLPETITNTKKTANRIQKNAGISGDAVQKTSILKIAGIALTIALVVSAAYMLVVG